MKEKEHSYAPLPIVALQQRVLEEQQRAAMWKRRALRLIRLARIEQAWAHLYKQLYQRAKRGGNAGS